MRMRRREKHKIRQDLQDIQDSFSFQHVPEESAET